ncbi:MAG: hypothetical protein GY847_30620 [Proteobacteria bacterium]|nr:hypothetical protein [Pseudomonadota bacterium]
MENDLATLIERLELGEEVTIIGLGDSLTYGWMVSTGFFDRFLDSLEIVYPRATITRINAGIPGDTASGGLARMGSVLKNQPDLIVVQFGLNDMFQRIDPASFEQSLIEIVEKGHEAGVAIVLTTSCPLPWEEGQSAATIFYKAIQNVGTLTGTPVANLDRHWLKTIEKQTDHSPGRLYISDGVHPSDAGHALMAEGLLSLFS